MQMDYSKKFSLVVAVNDDSLIGIKEYGSYSMPWPMLKEDMDFFRRITTTTIDSNNVNAIIMGYNTWQTLPDFYRKNTKRFNIIISRSSQTDKVLKNEKYVESFDKAL